MLVLAELPAISVAIALTECWPARLKSAVAEYGALLSVAIVWPSTTNVTLAIATLSLAVAVIVTRFDTEAPFAGDVMAIVGGIRSAAGPGAGGGAGTDS